MKKIALVIAVLAAGVFAYFYRSPVDMDQMMSVAEMKEDYALLRESLEEAAPTLYLYTPKEEMDAFFDGMQAKLEQPMPRRSFCKLVFESVAKINDAHTRVHMGRGARSWFNDKKSRLPMKLRILDGRAFVERDYGAGEAWLGVELLKINNRPMTEIVDDMLTLLSTDGGNKTGGYAQLGETTDFAFLHWMLYGPTESFNIEYRKPDGGIERKTLEGNTQSQLAKAYRAKYAGKGPEPIRLEWQGDTPVLHFRHFGLVEVDGKPMDQFLKETFEEIEKRGSANLIIDLGLNSGGSMESPAMLAAYLLPEPFYLTSSNNLAKKAFDFYEHAIMTPPGKALDEMQQRPDGSYWKPEYSDEVHPMKPVFKGELYVIVEGINHSSASLFINALHRANRATFVGEEVMGSYGSFSAGIGGVLELGHCDLNIMIPVMRLDQPEAPAPHKDRGVQPQIPVTQSIDDIIAGRSTGVEYVLDLIKSK